MQKLLIALALICSFAACRNHREEPNPYDTEKALELFRREFDAGPGYYPPKEIFLQKLDRIIKRDTGYFADAESSLKQKEEMYNRRSMTLKKLHLDDLRTMRVTDTIEAYRLWVLRAFIREEICLTIENRKENATLMVQGLQFTKDFNPLLDKFNPDLLEITRNHKRQLSQKEWNDFLRIVTENEFWDLNELNGDQGIDGSDWYLEGSKPDYYNTRQMYKRMHRWAPEQYTGIYKIGKYLIDLSGEDWGEIY